MPETNDIKRYVLDVHQDSPVDIELREHEQPDGDWVKWADVARLAAENAGLRAAIERFVRSRVNPGIPHGQWAQEYQWAADALAALAPPKEQP